MANKISIPDFFFIPHIPHAPHEKLIFSPKHLAYWQVREFANREALENWVGENDLASGEFGYTVAIHERYPYMLLCIDVRTEIAIEKLVKLGIRASDWYAQFWIKEVRRSREQNEGYKAFYIAENRIEWEGQEAIIKLSYPRVFIRYKLSDAFFASYEQFYQSIAIVEWLDDEKPEDPAELQIVLNECWNYLSLEERKLEEDND